MYVNHSTIIIFIQYHFVTNHYIFKELYILRKTRGEKSRSQAVDNFVILFFQMAKGAQHFCMCLFFLPCIYCLGFVSLGEMWRHVRNGRHATLTNTTKPENNCTSTIAQARMLLAGAHRSSPRWIPAKRVWRVIVNNMRERGDERHC